MKRLQAYKFQLKTNLSDEAAMRRIAGSCRYVWNKALALQLERYEQAQKKHGYAELCKIITEWRNGEETAFLYQSPIHPLQQTLKDLDRAYKNFFEKRADFPQFKKSGRLDSFRYPDPKQFKVDQDNSRVYLPKIGWIQYRNSRIIEGTPKNVTVSQSGGHWYISIQTEREVEQPVHSSTSIIGIDVGIAKLATLSDGTVFEPINSFKKHQQRLARYQRAMSRKQKFSSNWKKAKAKVQKLHARIANTRRDYLHKTTTAISKNHAIVCIEDLKVSNMSKSAKGTIQASGKNVRAKSGLNRSILDQGWFEFRRQLEYKQLWRGGEVLVVPARNTSRTCPMCNHVSADNRKTQANFACVNCEYKNNADIVGALNILAAGHVVLACGEIVPLGYSMKQEPTEAIQACA